MAAQRFLSVLGVDSDETMGKSRVKECLQVHKSRSDYSRTPGKEKI
jgi:hypothetical protein